MALPRQVRARRRRLAELGALLTTLGSGCFSPSEGLEPPGDELYFPVGLAVDATADYLFVVNSDFDLKYRSGSLMSLDLGRLNDLVPRPCNVDADCSGSAVCDNEPGEENDQAPSYWCVERGERPCGGLGERPAQEQLLYPGRCGHVELSRPQDGGGSLIRDVVKIGAFGRNIAYLPRPPTAPAGPPARLAVTVAGDATLHWIDVTRGQFDCGQRGNDGACDDRHRAGDDPDAENSSGLKLATEPFGVAAAEDGSAIVVTHQTLSAASLFVHDWTSRGPRLVDTATGLPQDPVGIAPLPVPAVVPAGRLGYRPGFFVAFREAGTIDLLRYFDDIAASPSDPFLARMRTTSVGENTLGTDSRGIGIDASARRSREDACREEAGLSEECLLDPECLAGAPDTYRICVTVAAAVPLGVYVANRAPASLLVGQTSGASQPVPASDVPAFNDSIPLPFGPSTVVVGNITNAEGDAEARVFVVCYDSRWIFIYDPKTRAIEADVKVGRGPQALAIDARRARAYVGHFTDSYVGVINLDQRFPRTYGKLLATIGKPTPPRAAK